MLIAVDQLLFWSFATRPIASLRVLVEPTNSPDPPHFQLRPGLDTTYASWRRGDLTRVRTNRLGFRDRERSAARPSGVRRVIAAGDSIAFGLGVNDEEAFPQQLERRLAEGGAAVEVWNAGVPGYAMADHLGLLRKRLLALAPDVIVLQISRNDAAAPMQPPDPALFPLLRVSGFARLWALARSNLLEDAPLFRESFRAYVDECRRAGIRLVIFHEGLPRSCAADVLGAAAASGVPVVDSGKDTLPKLPDDPHYSAEGNRMVAERLAPAVLAALSAQ